MSKIKKIIRGGFESAVEFLKPATKIVTPDRIAGQIIGPSSGQNEMTEYLRKLGDHKESGNPQKKDQLDGKQTNPDENVQNLRTYLQSIPSHLRPPVGPPPLRPYEATVKDHTDKLAEKAKVEENSAPFVTPTGKRRGMMGKKHQPSSDMERKINKKSG